MVALAVLAGSSICRAAGDGGEIRYGDRIRLKTTAQERIVIVDVITPEHLLYHTAEGLAPGNVRWTEVLKLEKETPRSRGEGMLYGMQRGSIYGFAIGFVFGFVGGLGDGGCDSSDQELGVCIDPSPVAGGFIFGAAGALAGIIIGAPLGSLEPGTEWQEVERPFGTEPGNTGAGGLSAGLSFSF
jgi:hypothetical protein